MRMPPKSQRQQYLDWVDARLEDHKAGLTRDELLQVADEAVQRLFAARDGQYPLTEILMRDAVDALLFERLGLPSYRSWRRTACQSDTEERPVEETAEPQEDGRLAS